MALQYKTNHLHTSSRQFWGEVHQQEGRRTPDECVQKSLCRYKTMEGWALHKNARKIGLILKAGQHGHVWLCSKNTQGILSWTAKKMARLAIYMHTKTIWGRITSRISPRAVQGSRYIRKWIHPTTDRLISLSGKNTWWNSTHSIVNHSITTKLTKWSHNG